MFRAPLLAALAAVSLATLSTPALAAPRAAPLVYAGEEVSLPNLSPTAEKGGGGGGGKTWFAFQPPENLKPVLADKKMLLIIVGMALGALGGNIWGPLAFAGASFDMEWALPSIIYTVISAACLLAFIWWLVPYVGWFTGWLFVIVAFGVSMVVNWINAMTTMTNLNRPEIQLKK